MKRTGALTWQLYKIGGSAQENKSILRSNVARVELFLNLLLSWNYNNRFIHLFVCLTESH